MDDSLAREIRELKARLDDAEAKSSAAEARWNAAEARRNTAEAKIDAAEAKASAAEAKLRPLNVDEYLIACHDLLQLSLTFPESKSQGTQGLTRVMGKFYPKTIQQDQTLARDHEKYIDLALKALRADRLDTRPHFPSTTEIEYDARALGKGLVACERDVEYWIIVAVQKHATNILASLSGEALQRRWEPHKKISFVNHQRHLQETTPFAPPMGRANPSPTDPKINSTSALMTRDLAADKLCVHYADESKEKSQRILFPIEYKPPHKVFADLLRRGLKLRSIKDEILDNVHAPTRSSRKRKHGEGGQRAPMSEAELNSLALEVVAMVLTQTYDKMVTARVEHGLLTTGESFVWLYVAKNDPTTLKWHLTVPGAVLPSSQNPLQFRETAVTQLVGWCLMVFDRFKGQHSQDWFQALKPKLAKWMYNDDDLLANIPETPTKAKKNSPYPPRKKHSKNTCGEKKLTARPHDDRDDGSPSKDKSPYPPAPQGSRQNPSRKTSAQQTRGSHQQTPPQSMEHAPYCTQACLQGLTQGLVMDTSCPNHALHLQQTSSPHHHPLTTSTLISLLYAQLKAHPDDGIYPQGIMGACGYLFKLALLSHGYVLVGKGTIPPPPPPLVRSQSLQLPNLPARRGDPDLSRNFQTVLRIPGRHGR
ncbi:uncharacterized protein KY384_000041 [Bacidia gigantensis]|uniref:uncharacterized protein n=1 Tax=Bacidia gigantensis TaxID=2732470 RepID=UPI001D04D003|nr:uncharacterized protein KY384_000041 [Bacidia gigantensis]KAG8526448.1 hypothetical protein KY384_000041 [Bacidia gigantensis]